MRKNLEKREQVKKLLNDWKTWREIKEVLSVWNDTISSCSAELKKLKEWTNNELKNELDNNDYVKEIEDSEIKRNYTILKRKYKDLLDVAWTNNEMERVWQQTQKHWDMKIEKRSDKIWSESTANIVLSDWHIEEIVDPNTINGINEYDPSIAKERATKVFQNWLSLVDMMAKDEKINTVNFALLWDFISGYIHPELMENNAMSPTEAILFAKDIITSWLDLFIRESDYDLNIVTAFGNHGRTTDKKRISTWWKNSFEWMLYVLIAQQYLWNDRIKFKIEKGYHNYQQIYDKIIRWHHWDWIRYQWWVWWITIPLNKAIAQWNKVKHADYDGIGHWHQHRDTGNAVVNGSLIGYWPYAESIKADFEDPKQAFFLINSKFGKTISAPIFVV